MEAREPVVEARAGAAAGRGGAGAAAALAVLGLAALALAALGSGLEPLLPVMLLATWPASRLRLAPGLAGLAAVLAVPLLVALAGRAPALRPGPYALAAAALWAAAGLALGHFADLRRRLRQAQEDGARLSAVDRLTGVATRAELVRQGQQLVSLARRGRRSLAVLVLDVDRLREINQRFDLAVGDEVLRSVAARLREALRNTDLVGRLGEDELGVVMPDTDRGGARAAAERARGAVADDGLFAPGSRAEVRFTVSVGLAVLGEGDLDLESLLRRAEGALSAAKKAGGDRSEVAA